MKRLAVLAIALPSAAAALGEQSRDTLLTALWMNECAVTEDETAEVFGAQGFDAEFVRRELGEMVLDGTAFLERGYILRVPAEHCPPADPVPTPAQAFRSAILERGCSIEDREVRSLDIDAGRIRPVVSSWIETGAARIEGSALLLRDCQ